MSSIMTKTNIIPTTRCISCGLYFDSQGWRKRTKEVCGFTVRLCGECMKISDHIGCCWKCGRRQNFWRVYGDDRICTFCERKEMKRGERDEWIYRP